MTVHNKFRRRILAGIVGVASSVPIIGRAATAVLTPDATEGPFYPRPRMRKPDIDNDLVKIVGQIKEAGGEIITLRGTVRDDAGNPRVGHRVEIWQCDVDGNYMHTADTNSTDFDPAFQGFGHDITDEEGGYVFRTIKPTVYPGRTPHIHVKVFADDREILTTQFYIDGDPQNKRDRIFRQMSKAEAKSVSMVFVETDDGLETTINMTI